MEPVRREDFVPGASPQEVLSDAPLPIGHGQTISQPSLVQRMTDELGVRPGHRVLEIGTGSGYQAAILAQCGAEVFTLEVIESLAREAAERLRRLGYANVHVRHADGFDGWAEEAPFDGIMVTAAAEEVPPTLRNQLADGGRLIIPVGPVDAVQTLYRIERRADDFVQTELMPVRFVPFTRGTR